MQSPAWPTAPPCKPHSPLKPTHHRTPCPLPPQAFQACGVFGMSAVTALTAQNTHGVSSVHTPPAEFLGHQIDAVLGDLGADAVKTGMLPTAEVVRLVAEKVGWVRVGAGAPNV